jgi:hypothetical protein
MKYTCVYFVAALIGFFGFPSLNATAETAQARIFCYSVVVHGATGTGGATLDLTTAASSINEELAPWFGTRTHSSFIVLDDGFEVIEGTMDLDVPPYLDANGDGFDDFYDTSLGVASTMTGGDLSLQFTNGTVTAQWTRSAGSKDGTVVLSLTDNGTGFLGNFSHSFELLEYKGPLTYAPGATNVTGAVAFTRTGSASETLQGQIRYNKSPTNSANELEMQAGGWTNASAQTLSFMGNLFYRDPLWWSNYYGYVEFADGQPNTGAIDYNLWMMSIDDTNDSDHDGIPNFSDTSSGGGGPRRPTLALTRGTTNLWLRISGGVGRLHHILGSASLSAPSWQTNLSVTLTNDPQTVSLPLPAASQRYWRAYVP